MLKELTPPVLNTAEEDNEGRPEKLTRGLIVVRDSDFRTLAKARIPTDNMDGPFHANLDKKIYCRPYIRLSPERLMQGLVTHITLIGKLLTYPPFSLVLLTYPLFFLLFTILL
jgi:hypothetical protein